MSNYYNIFDEASTEYLNSSNYEYQLNSYNLITLVVLMHFFSFKYLEVCVETEILSITIVLRRRPQLVFSFICFICDFYIYHITRQITQKSILNTLYVKQTLQPSGRVRHTQTHIFKKHFRVTNVSGVP